MRTGGTSRLDVGCSVGLGLLLPRRTGNERIILTAGEVLSYPPNLLRSLQIVRAVSHSLGSLLIVSRNLLS